jgi:hypothetical protein
LGTESLLSLLRTHGYKLGDLKNLVWDVSSSYVASTDTSPKLYRRMFDRLPSLRSLQIHLKAGKRDSCALLEGMTLGSHKIILEDLRELCVYNCSASDIRWLRLALRARKSLPIAKLDSLTITLHHYRLSRMVHEELKSAAREFNVLPRAPDPPNPNAMDEVGLSLLMEDL